MEKVLEDNIELRQVAEFVQRRKALIVFLLLYPRYSITFILQAKATLSIFSNFTLKAKGSGIYSTFWGFYQSVKHADFH